MSNSKISIAHPEGSDSIEHGFYNSIVNSDKETLEDVYDVYFGKTFTYTHNGVVKTYGNCMGVESTDEQVDDLFKIQDEFGIQISLTMNQLNIPPEIHLDSSILGDFIDFIGSFYGRGLRSCTISNIHLMTTGMLHRAFPEMKWKNTVNHKVSDAQQMIDMYYCGYDIIQLDRSLNRNIPELKKIRKAADLLISKFPKRKKLLLAMLVKEACLYSCPFKSEHDNIGNIINVDYFTGLGNISCNNWRNSEISKTPRSGLNMEAKSKETYDLVNSLVDIIKFSGRFDRIVLESSLIWVLIDDSNTVVARSINEIISFGNTPIGDWTLTQMPLAEIKELNHLNEKVAREYSTEESVFWFSKKGIELEKTLLSCKSQCWDCHKCEDAFDLPRVLSLLPEHIS